MDATLERVSRDINTSTSNGGDQFHFQVNGNPDDRTIQMMKESVKQAVKQAKLEVASDMASGRGDVSKAMGNWTTKRRVS